MERGLFFNYFTTKHITSTVVNKYWQKKNAHNMQLIHDRQNKLNKHKMKILTARTNSLTRGTEATLLN